MNKNKIVIASILKPVDDTRMYEKIGLSLAKTSKYDVNIIGFSVKNIPNDENVTFHPIFDFSRLSFKRLLAPFKCYRLLRKLKPKTLIINSHELLLMGAIFCIFNKTFYIYDVRENYYRNILYTTTFPKIIKPFIAYWVRLKEYMSYFFIDHYFLAEQYYEHEFSFTKGKSTVIENKYQPIDEISMPADRNSSGTNLLFSGTIAESTGVFNAIDLAITLHKVDPSITLDIIGYSSVKSVIDSVKSKIISCDFITLFGGDKLIAHHEVISKIHSANFGIIFYPYNKSTINSTPTKLYEYLANSLPVLVQNHPKWQSICHEYSAGIVIDFDNYTAKSVLNQMKSNKYYTDAENGAFLWRTEEEKLLNFLEINNC